MPFWLATGYKQRSYETKEGECGAAVRGVRRHRHVRAAATGRQHEEPPGGRLPGGVVSGFWPRSGGAGLSLLGFLQQALQGNRATSGMTGCRRCATPCQSTAEPAEFFPSRSSFPIQCLCQRTQRPPRPCWIYRPSGCDNIGQFHIDGS